MKITPVIPLLLLIVGSAKAELSIDRKALERTASEATSSPLSAIQAATPGTAVAVSTNRPFCTSDFYVYRDRPISSYALTCRNESLGLVFRHDVSYDARTLFEPNGRCSSKHIASVSLWSRRTLPFELSDNNERPSSQPREFSVLRDEPGLHSGEFLASLVWIQDGDSFRLGSDPRTGRIFHRAFRPESQDGESFRLRATGVPLNFTTTQRINGRAVAYRDLPVDCTLDIQTDDWPRR